MKSLKYYLINPKALIIAIIVKYLTCLPDKIYLSLLYRIKMGYWMNWKNPLRFNEKLQWLKVYYRKPELTLMVDKIEVKNFVRKTIGKEYVIPTLAIWNSIDEIDLSNLPDKFVLKTNNGGGGIGIVICKDKSNFSMDKAKIVLRSSLNQDIYKTLKEWPYKNINHKIFAEALISANDGTELNDYKFLCFDGQPKVMFVSHGRFYGTTCFDYYDMDFNLLPLMQGGPNSGKTIAKPANFDKMKELASKLSKGLPHARIDLYNVNGHIYFGEITFFDSSGFAEFDPEEWDYKFGDWINLNKAR